MLLIDQDAKILAVNTFFDPNINFWDIASIGAALYGIAKQGKDFFHTERIVRSSIIYADVQIYAHMIGSVRLSGDEERELLLIVIGEHLNTGFIIGMMKTW